MRIGPALGEIDERRVLEAIGEELRRTDSDALAEALWASSGSLEVHRARPLLSEAGKALPLMTAVPPDRRRPPG